MRLGLDESSVTVQCTGGITSDAELERLVHGVVEQYEAELNTDRADRVRHTPPILGRIRVALGADRSSREYELTIDSRLGKEPYESALSQLRSVEPTIVYETSAPLGCTDLSGILVSVKTRVRNGVLDVKAVTRSIDIYPCITLTEAQEIRLDPMYSRSVDNTPLESHAVYKQHTAELQIATCTEGNCCVGQHRSGSIPLHGVCDGRLRPSV